jgi:hypothetical protein
MKSMKILAAVAAVAATVAVSSPAAAQATRTWVSGVGDDVNPCSRTAPCKTFAGAISKTAARGEISCLDSGGFGGVTITKAIAIICDGVVAGVLAPSTTGIVINAASTDSIFLSGLDIHGGGTGFRGVRYVSAASVHIHNSTIQKFEGAGGVGISFAPAAAGNLVVTNTNILNNGGGGTGGGIEIVPTGSATSKVTLEGVQLGANANIGLRVDMAAATGGSVSISVEDSHLVSGQTGISLSAPGAAAAVLMLVRSEVANNYGAGLTADGAKAMVRVGDTSITGNQSGVTATNSAAVLSYGNNRLDANPAATGAANGAFTGPVSPK